VLKYYFNPYRPLLLEFEEGENLHVLQELGMSYKTDLLTDTELIEMLDRLYLTTKCFGKYDIFNKWLLFKVDGLKSSVCKEKVKERLRKLMLRVATTCIRCPYQDKCSNSRIPLDELLTYWDSNIFVTRAEQFIREDGKEPWKQK
jgi:hypothetical protein